MKHDDKITHTEDNTARWALPQGPAIIRHTKTGDVAGYKIAVGNSTTNELTADGLRGLRRLITEALGDKKQLEQEAFERGITEGIERMNRSHLDL